MPATVKLALGAIVVVGVTLYMAYVGASSSWKYYLTAEEYLADAAKFSGQRLRVSGKVASASLRVDADRLHASFALAGNHAQLPVDCACALPDNLAEGGEVVVEGCVDAAGTLRGEKVLTRCASKYEAKSSTAARDTAPTRGELP